MKVNIIQNRASRACGVEQGREAQEGHAQELFRVWGLGFGCILGSQGEAVQLSDLEHGFGGQKEPWV